jgi:hypothetical protein
MWRLLPLPLSCHSTATAECPIFNCRHRQQPQVWLVAGGVPHTVVEISLEKSS